MESNTNDDNGQHEHDDDVADNIVQWQLVTLNLCGVCVGIICYFKLFIYSIACLCVMPMSIINIA